MIRLSIKEKIKSFKVKYDKAQEARQKKELARLTKEKIKLIAKKDLLIQKKSILKQKEQIRKLKQKTSPFRNMIGGMATQPRTQTVAKSKPKFKKKTIYVEGKRFDFLEKVSSVRKKEPVQKRRSGLDLGINFDISNPKRKKGKPLDLTDMTF